MKLKLILFPILLGLVVWVSCEKPINPVERGPLTFNQDTVKFDSIFTTLLTPSERLIVINENSRAVKITNIKLEKGEESEFSMIVDGIQADDVDDIVIPTGDSIHIFVNLRSEIKDDYAQDYIIFQVGDEVQRVLIQGFIVDAYFLRARLQQEDDFLNLDPGSFYFRQDTTLTPDKPIIFDGPIYIPENVTVTVLPGTDIFFTPYRFGVKDSSGRPTFGFYSWLIVDGTLQAEGLPGFPIRFLSSRLQDSLYVENPAQWRGLQFRGTSKDNILKHCIIKNALIGVEVDFMPVNDNPKVSIQYSQIRNMGVHGIVGVGLDSLGQTLAKPPTILMENSIVNTSKLHNVFLLGGGKYNFFNCTFANFNLRRFARRTPMARISNWYTFDGVTANIYPSYTQFTNCILWGSEEDEVVLDTLEGAPYDNLIFDHCLVRVSEEYEPNLDPHLLNSFKNQDPLFNDYFVRDYRPKEGSPVINTGIDFPFGSTGYEDDYRGLMDSLRYDGFDIGAYEYYPIPE